ncbi:hypothetical protein HAALTHF_29260n [Vreelandella aquamarina]|nr:hypothetical protein HAALTHF_29260n [Halomonas axialensis]
MMDSPAWLVRGAATGAELYVGHGTVWVNGDNGYIAMQVSGLEVLPGAGLTDSGKLIHFGLSIQCLKNGTDLK